MKTIAACTFAFAILVLAGCQEPPLHTRKVLSLSFPVSPEYNRMTVSVGDTDVQEVLKTVSGILVADGFVRDPNEPTSEESGVMGSYAKFNSAGIRKVGILDLYLKSDQLQVVFIELGNRTGHLKHTKQLFSLLQSKLKTRYGTNRVKVAR